MNRQLAFSEYLAQNHKDTIALNDTQGTKICYGQLISEVEKLSKVLDSHRITGFATAMDNSPAHVIALISTLDTTTWALPLPPFFTKKQRENALDSSGCSAILSDTQLPDVQLLEEFYLGERKVYLYRTHSNRIEKVRKGTTLVTFTSGSTDEPKGLCLSTENILTTSKAIASALDNLAIKRHLSVLPLSILLEQTAGVFSALITGAECLIPSLSLISTSGKTKSITICHLLQRTNANSCIFVPELLKLILSEDKTELMKLKSLRFIAVGGAKTSHNMLEKAKSLGLPVYEGYGLSEAASVVTLNTPQDSQRGSVGLPLFSNGIFTSESGEIMLRTPSFLGYCGSNDPPPSPFPTGDLGEINTLGYLYISGRKKNVLITSMGRNVSPEWVESLLIDCVEIEQAFVHGDGQSSLSALIVSDQSHGDIQQSINRINSLLPDYAHIASWRRADRFTVKNGTLTGNGKLRRDAISNLHLSEDSAAYAS